MEYFKEKNSYIFWLYHLGFSKATLSNICLNLELTDLISIYQGHSLGKMWFSNREKSLLRDKEKIEMSKREAIDYLKEFVKYKVHIITYFDKDFPKELLNIPNPPFILFFRGNFRKLNSCKLISIAGSRKTSGLTSAKLRSTVANIISLNFGVVSGLAFGTDIIANSTAAQLGGYSAAVLPGSILSIIPESHKKHADNILRHGGVLISEYYKQATVSKNNFIARNRIISGLGICLLLSEFNVRSGTMHTARFAFKQRKKIFCFYNSSPGIEKILSSGYGTVFRNANQFNELK